MRRSRAWLSRGSTVIEVLMAITVLAVGASGIIAMQKLAAVSNRNAKNLEIANEVARTWVERLQGDAMLWNHPSQLDGAADLGDTRWLVNVRDPNAEMWFRPEDGGMYGVHDAFGKDDTSGTLAGPFCVNLRLTWLRPGGTERASVMRAEVRVYWLRDGIQSSADVLPDAPDPLCGDTWNAPPAVDATPELFHFLHVTTAVRKNQPL